MAFSSALFLYGFVPVFFSLYYLVGSRYRNAVLLAASLSFYAVGAGPIVLILLASVWVNQVIAVRIARSDDDRARRRLLAAGVAVNLLGLAYYKYTTFAWDIVRDAAILANLGSLPAAPEIPLPIGISFFTFQAVSYLVDVYRRDIAPASGCAEFANYHSLFPQLVAGPIVRYREVKPEMSSRHVDLQMIAEGVYRFCLGLGKKLILADNLGVVADAAFEQPAGQLGFLQAWLGITCYTLQIYFDFSGYSDMAIGLGRLLGFRFPENFEQPYRASSVTEFWRRWHMTLSRWFRDYLYIPLGGNRSGAGRTYLNLWIVFFFCGLWHGAGATFVAWGLYHGSLLVIERVCAERLGWRPSGIAGTVATIFLVMIGWVLFRAPTLTGACDYLGAMFTPASGLPVSMSLLSILQVDAAFYLGAGLAFALAPLQRFESLRFDRIWIMAIQATFAVSCFAYALLMLAANSFNPFIYFRF